jgi:hypothetical protein
METFLDILKYTLPAIIVLITAAYVIKSFFDNEQQKRRMDARVANQKFLTPVRIQAYERLTLYLERINPESLVMRLMTPSISAKQLQSDMLSTIRAEYEHNLSQQIYVTSQLWEVLKSSKENVTKLINSVSDEIEDGASGMQFSKKLLEILMEVEKSPTTIALEYLKNEFKQVM